MPVWPRREERAKRASKLVSRIIRRKQRAFKRVARSVRRSLPLPSTSGRPWWAAGRAQRCCLRAAKRAILVQLSQCPSGRPRAGYWEPGHSFPRASLSSPAGALWQKLCTLSAAVFGARSAAPQQAANRREPLSFLLRPGLAASEACAMHSCAVKRTVQLKRQRRAHPAAGPRRWCAGCHICAAPSGCLGPGAGRCCPS